MTSQSHDVGGIQVVAFDFEAKRDQTIELAAVDEAVSRGQFVWIDFDIADEATLDTLRQNGFVDERILEAVLNNPPTTRCARFEDCVHLVLCDTEMDADHFERRRLDAVMGEQKLVTIRRGPSSLLTAMRAELHNDFVQHAKTPSFLVYELWDHLLQSAAATQSQLEQQVQSLQKQLMQRVDEKMFERLSVLGANLLEFRSVLVPMRSTLDELALRKSVMISESTRQSLADMAPVVERLLEDVLADREILSESLNLHMSMIAYRTNETVKRLTSVSIIFLPLTFLVGVYGMNFVFFPELKWRYGYAIFWVVTIVLTVVQAIILRKKKLL